MGSAMLKVTVVKPEASVVSWRANAQGREAGSMRVQEIWVHTVEQDGTPAFAPTRVELILNRERVDQVTGEILTPAQAAYPAGEYTLHPSSVYVNRDGKLSFAARLTPMKRTG